MIENIILIVILVIIVGSAGLYIYNSKKLLEEVFADDASYALGIYMWELGKESYEDDTPIAIRLFKLASVRLALLYVFQLATTAPSSKPSIAVI